MTGDAIARRRNDLKTLAQLEADAELEIHEEPSSDLNTFGSFSLQLEPSCGGEEAFCSAQLRVTFGEFDSENVYEIDEDQADGLDNESLGELRDAVLMGQADGKALYDILLLIRDKLASLNSQTKGALKKNLAAQFRDEAAKREAEREAFIEEQSKRHAEYEKNQIKQWKEDHAWRESVSIPEFEPASVKILTQGDSKNRKSMKAMREQTNFSDTGVKKLVPLEQLNAGGSRYDQDFEELDKIGSGGFGHVYRARHRLDGHIYAVKKIKLSASNAEEN